MSLDECFQRLNALPGDSIYDDPRRMAQPDEVWNFSRGDGLEKAIAMANMARARVPEERIRFEKQGSTVTVMINRGGTYSFTSGKNLNMPREEDAEFAEY